MTEDAESAKRRLRQLLRARRRARTPDELSRVAAALDERAKGCDAAVIAAFFPVHGEPGTVHTLDLLRDRTEVLLPVVSGAELGWARYGGRHLLVDGPFGLRQPAAADPALTLGAAEVVLTPAVALTMDGRRLGHGGGFYDRALAGIATERIVGVVHDDEVLLDLPVQPHDLRVGWVLTPSGLHRCAPGGNPSGLGAV